MKKRMIFMAAATIALAACSNDEMENLNNGVLPSDHVIRVEAGVGSTASRSLTTENISSFGMFVTNSNADLGTTYSYANVKMTKSDDTWNSSQQMLWQSETQEVSVVAYAPYAEAATLDDAIAITVNADQSTAANFIASDYVYGKAAVTPSATQNTDGDIYYDTTSKKLKVKMNHKLVKLNVTVTPTGNLAGLAVSGVKLKDVETSGSIDLADGTVSAGTSENTEIVMHAAENSYQAIFVPKSAQFSIELTVGDKAYTYTHPSSFNFEGGKEHNLTLSVGKQIVLVDDVTINAWGDGEDWSGEAH